MLNGDIEAIDNSNCEAAAVVRENNEREAADSSEVDQAAAELKIR